MKDLGVTIKLDPKSVAAMHRSVLAVTAALTRMSDPQVVEGVRRAVEAVNTRPPMHLKAGTTYTVIGSTPTHPYVDYFHDLYAKSPDAQPWIGTPLTHGWPLHDAAPLEHYDVERIMHRARQTSKLYTDKVRKDWEEYRNTPYTPEVYYMGTIDPRTTSKGSLLTGWAAVSDTLYKFSQDVTRSGERHAYFIRNSPHPSGEAVLVATFLNLKQAKDIRRTGEVLDGPYLTLAHAEEALRLPGTFRKFPADSYGDPDKPTEIRTPNGSRILSYPAKSVRGHRE